MTGVAGALAERPRYRSCPAQSPLPLFHLRNKDLLRVEDLVDEAELLPGRRERFAGNAGGVEIEMAHLPDLLRGLAVVAGVEVDPSGLLVEAKDPGRADHRRRSPAEGGAVELPAMDDLPAGPPLHPPPWARNV